MILYGPSPQEPKTLKPPGKHGAAIIAFKDQIHERWNEVQQTQDKDEDWRYVPQTPVRDILKFAHNAIQLMKEDPRTSPLFVGGKQALKTYLEEHPGERPLADLIREMNTHIKNLRAKIRRPIVRRNQRMFRLTPSEAVDLITVDINALANSIHQIGTSLLSFKQDYCGCRIAGDAEEISEINDGVLAYCRGALRLGGVHRGIVLPPGDSVEHRPGAAHSHACNTKFQMNEDGTYDTEVLYHESGDDNWRDRMDGVQDRLESLGLYCKGGGYLQLECDGTLEKDDITKLALTISQLKDIDLLNGECIPPAFDNLDNELIRLLKQYADDPEEMWRAPWTRASHSEAVAECQAGIEDRREDDQKWEQREQERQEKQEQRELERLEEREMEILARRSEPIEAALGKPGYDVSLLIHGQDLMQAEKEIRKLKNEVLGYINQAKMACKAYHFGDTSDLIEKVDYWLKEHKVYGYLDWTDMEREILEWHEKDTRDILTALAEKCDPVGYINMVEVGYLPSKITDSDIRQTRHICEWMGWDRCIEEAEMALGRLYGKEVPGTLFHSGDIEPRAFDYGELAAEMSPTTTRHNLQRAGAYIRSGLPHPPLADWRKCSGASFWPLTEGYQAVRSVRDRCEEIKKQSGKDYCGDNEVISGALAEIDDNFLALWTNTYLGQCLLEETLPRMEKYHEPELFREMTGSLAELLEITQRERPTLLASSASEHLEEYMADYEKRQAGGLG